MSSIKQRHFGDSRSPVRVFLTFHEPELVVLDIAIGKLKPNGITLPYMGERMVRHNQPTQRKESPLAKHLRAMLAKVPGVVITQKMNSVNFTAKKKVFAFTKADGVVLKLPPETIEGLVESKRAIHLVVGKRTMKEWVVLHYPNPAECKRDLPIFKQAMEYASSAAK